MPKRYTIDTSALLDGWSRYYPPTVFPALWEKVESAIEQDVIGMSREAYDEILKKDDDLKAWIQSRRRDFVIDSCSLVQETVAKIMADPFMANLVDLNRQRSEADPFVIGSAVAHGLIVVTGEDENARKARTTKPRIPNICDILGVPRCKFLDFIRKEGWAF